MPSDVNFRELLIDLMDAFSIEDRGRFIFMLSDDIPASKRQEPLTEIFTILIDRGLISESDCSYLVEILKKIKLMTLAYKVAQFQTRHSPPPIIGTLPLIPNILTIENTQNLVPTRAEFLEDLTASDTMIISDYEQNNSPDTTPTIAESESIIISLSLKNIDLKVFENDLRSDEYLKKINVNIHPYEYQRELVQNAIQAGNTIICLRTGGGKTFIAALLLKYYLIKKMTLSNENEKSKFLAFFIVPRRAMLKQQLNKLKQFGNFRVKACDENNDIIQYINNNDIIICTPQKLLNCLKRQTIFLSNIDVLCFDECHDMVVRNQYIGIMQYLMCKNIEHIPPVNSSPIVIGLTAEIGFHQSNSKQIINNLILFCAIFNCLTITTILKEENEEELERYVNHISEDEILCIDKEKEFDTLRLSIEKELKDLILELFVNNDTNPLRIFPEKEIDMNGYEQNLEILKQSEQKNQHFISVLLINYILTIYRHCKSLIDLTPELVLSNLKDDFQMTYKSREHPIAIDTLIYEKCQNLFKKKLTEIEQSEKILSNPKLDKLVEVLKIHSEKPNSRALILVERIFYAKKICEFLQNHSELKNIIKPCWLVGHNDFDYQKTYKNEDLVLNDFQIGTYNVMISTDVVQAGLNIPQCSLVLRYDFVPDSIGTVQARVRKRTMDCVYYLITTKNSQNYTKELDNRQCEQDLKEGIEAWKRTPSDLFKQRVIERQTSLITEWNENLTRVVTSKINTSKYMELVGDVLCRACGYFLGHVAQLRRYEHAYFINDSNFYNRIEEKLSSEPRVYKKSSVTGKAFCGSKNCRAKLGCIEILDDYLKISPIYPLKCKSIKIKLIEKENGNENIILSSQWSKMPFQIPSFETLCTKNNDDNDDAFYDAEDSQFNDL